MGPSRLLLISALFCILGFSSFHSLPLEDTIINEVVNDASNRILGGELASPSSFKYQAAILEKLRHICGGSIINDKYVITAASCVTTSTGTVKSTNNLHVGVGYSNLNIYNDTVAYRVSRIFIHQDFNITTLQRNIALIRIQDYFVYGTTVFPVQIGTTVPERYSIQCVTVGYGQLWVAPAAPNVQELYTSTMYVSNCQSISPSPATNTLCAHSYNTSRGICEGDRGAPLVCGQILVGVTSHSNCVINGTAVYTSVPAYTSWITEVIQNSGPRIVASGVLIFILAVLALGRGST